MDRPPRWYRFAWFLGRPPALTDRQWRVLGLVSIVSFFEQYDVYLFALNLAQIQASLAIADDDLGWFGSIVRAGALLAILVTLLADRLGRRRVLLLTVVAYTTLTTATAFAPDATTFVALQFLARLFAVAETVLAAVVIVEEFPAEHRGWGIGAFAALQASGAGVAALLFGFVDVLPYGWRALYLVGVIPLLFVMRWRLGMPETERFERLAAARAARAVPASSELRALLGDYGGRFVVIAAAWFLTAFALAGVVFFQTKYLQSVHGWAPSAVATMIVIGGGLAIIANPLGGWLSDRFGRRILAAVFAGLSGCAAAAFYSSDALGGAGWLLVPVWIAFLFLQFGADTVITTYATEVFPTALRGAVNGARSLVGTIGSVAGLAAVAWLYPWFGSNWNALAVLPLLTLVAAAIAYFGFRETARLPLEAIAPD